MKIKKLKDKPLEKAQPKYLRDVKIVKTKNVLPSNDVKEEKYFPLERFKGTKWNSGEINKTVRKEEFQNMKTRGVVDFTDESDIKNNKTQNHETHHFMSKLEQFSDVWNDCPAVKNPKEYDESWYSKNTKPSSGNRTEDYNHTFNKTKSNNVFVGDSYNASSSKSIPKVKEKSMNNQRPENEISKQPEENSKKSKPSNYPLNSLQETENLDSNISDLKRKKAVQEHSQLHNDQKNIIKQALSLSMVSLTFQVYFSVQYVSDLSSSVNGVLSVYEFLISSYIQSLIGIKTAKK